MFQKALHRAACICLGALLPLACGTEQNVCHQAADYLNECLGEVGASSDGTCDQVAAVDLLSRTCDQLRYESKQAKADETWGPWEESACENWGVFCAKGEIVVDVAQKNQWSFEVDPISCVYVSLHDASGKQLAEGLTGLAGTRMFDELKEGDFTVRIYFADGELAHEQDVFVAYTPHGKREYVNFQFTADEKPSRFSRCAKVQGSLMTSMCGQEQPAAHNQWIVHAKPIDVSPVGVKFIDQSHESTPLFDFNRTYEEGSFQLGPLPFGTWNIQVWRIDVPDQANPDYPRLIGSRLGEPELVTEHKISIDSAEPPAVEISVRDPKQGFRCP